MRRTPGALLLSLIALAPAIARGQAAELVDDDLERPPPTISSELADLAGYSRFHLVARATFSDGESTFSDASTSSYEARLHVRLTEGLALATTIPFGLLVLPGAENQLVFGNFSLGVAGGFGVPLAGEGRRLRIGGAFDVYAPTAQDPAEDLPAGVAQAAVAGIRSLEPQLYLGDLMTFRARVQAALAIERFRAGLELGLAPGFNFDDDAELFMWLSVALRGSAHLTPALEPYLELGSAIQVAGPGDLSPPFLVTPGLRVHLGGFHPAVFVSFNFVEAEAILFGIDLAGVVVPSPRTRGEEIDDFFGNFD